MSTTAVVILNYNGSHFLEKFLPTLIEYTPTAQIIVADNKSTDHSLEVLEQFEEVQTILLNKNHGYAGGYNEALKQVEADYYALVNSDIEVTKNWLNELVAFLDHNQEYAAVQPKILDYQKRDHFEYAGASGGFMDALGYSYCRGRIFDVLEDDHGQYDTPEDVFWTTGACFVIRSKVFHLLGGFPADFFAHMEEVDLCWRLQSKSYRLASIPNSLVYHVGGGTLSKVNARKTYLNFRNNLRLLVRNLPLSRLILTLPIRIILDWLAAILFWKRHSFEHFQAVFLAHIDALKTLRKDWSHPLKSYPPLLRNAPLILFSHYLRGKNKYNEL